MNFKEFIKTILIPMVLAVLGFMSITLLDTFATKADLNALKESNEWQKTLLIEMRSDIRDIKQTLIEKK